jgi:hypothetical protein
VPGADHLGLRVDLTLLTPWVFAPSWGLGAKPLVASFKSKRDTFCYIVADADRRFWGFTDIGPSQIDVSFLSRHFSPIN